MIIAGANRDDVANPNGEVFDITRESVQHVSFGHGIHLCLGMALARLEAKIVFNTILDRFPNMGMGSQDVVWSNNMFVRGVERLVVECGETAHTPKVDSADQCHATRH